MFELLVVNPLTNLLIASYVLVGNNLGFALIVLTLFLRVLLLPLTIKQIQTQRKLQELQPRLQAIQRNAKDPSQLTPEEIGLMRETTLSCLGGLFPLLIQIPILFGLNSVIAQIASVNSDPEKGGDWFNQVLYFDFLKHSSDYSFNTNFFGLDLAIIPSHVPFGAEFIPFGVLMVLLVLTQFLQSKLIYSFQQNRSDGHARSHKHNKKKTKEELEKEELQQALNRWNQLQMIYVIPLAVGLGAYQFHGALGFYWLLQNIFTIVQTVIQYRFMDGKLNVRKLKDYLIGLIAK